MMIIHKIEQNSDEWYEARRGLVTASEFQTVQMQGRKKGDASKTRLTYLRRLAGELMTGTIADKYTNRHMERGHEMEAQARAAYRFYHEPQDLQLVGFVERTDLKTGGSPDALLGNDGVLEIKTQLPHLLIGTLRDDEFPSEHVAQCQGILWITERQWVDIAVFWPDMPVFVKRAFRDEDYIKELAEAVAQFNAELAEEVEWLRSL